ncbi:hypothetical protein ABLN97_03145 [Mycobacterium tuberculosis]
MMQQAVSALPAALGGAVGGVMGPLTQLPSRPCKRAGEQAAPLMSALQQTYGAEGLDVADGARLVDSVEGEPGPAASRALVTSARRRGWWHHPRRAIWVPHRADVVATDDFQPGRRPARMPDSG